MSASSVVTALVIALARLRTLPRATRQIDPNSDESSALDASSSTSGDCRAAPDRRDTTQASSISLRHCLIRASARRDVEGELKRINDKTSQKPERKHTKTSGNDSNQNTNSILERWCQRQPQGANPPQKFCHSQFSVLLHDEMYIFFFWNVYKRFPPCDAFAPCFPPWLVATPRRALYTKNDTRTVHWQRSRKSWRDGPAIGRLFPAPVYSFGSDCSNSAFRRCGARTARSRPVVRRWHRRRRFPAGPWWYARFRWSFCRPRARK